MLFKRILACACCLSGTLLGQGCHTDRGTDYSEKAVLAYAESNHGPDGALFLDPYFKKDLEALNREKVLDAGCGAAPWAIYAASNGGDVYAVDIQENMIIEAQRAAQKPSYLIKSLLFKEMLQLFHMKPNFLIRQLVYVLHVIFHLRFLKNILMN